MLTLNAYRDNIRYKFANSELSSVIQWQRAAIDNIHGCAVTQVAGEGFTCYKIKK